MPIYEYHCEPCHHTFETLIRSSSDVAHCPICGGDELAKQFSVPAAAQTGQGAFGALPMGDTSPKSLGCGAQGCGGGVCGMN